MNVYQNVKIKLNMVNRLLHPDIDRYNRNNSTEKVARVVQQGTDQLNNNCLQNTQKRLLARLNHIN